MLPHRSIEANSYARDGTVEKESLTRLKSEEEEIMRRIILACALAGILGGPAFGQASPKEQLVGVWALTSCYVRLSDREPRGDGFGI
jgi:hypothetical protein